MRTGHKQEKAQEQDKERQGTHTGHDSPTELARSLHDNDRTSGGTPNQRSPLTYIVSSSPDSPRHCLLLLLSPKLTCNLDSAESMVTVKASTHERVFLGIA